MILGLSVALLVLVFDQVTKFLVANMLLADVSSIAVTSFFNIIKAWNTGVSFSIFSGGGKAGVYVLSAVALAIVAALIWWLKNEKNKLLQMSIGFIIGGAIGNVIDRLRFGAVFDFLDVHAFGKHWPAFNVADSFICIGAVLIIICSILEEKEDKKK